MRHRLEDEDLRQQYIEAGMAGRVGFGQKPALLVIDMAHAWTRPSETLGSDLSDVLRRILYLLATAREREVPIFFTTMAYDEALAEVSQVVLRKTPLVRELVRGSELVALTQELERRKNEPLIEKPRQSPFYATSLQHMLISRDVDTTVVVGCSTSGCIRSTCESAFDLGYHVVVPCEAVGDRSRSAHDAALFDIDARFGDVISTTEVSRYLESLAGS
jgi:maleamate amidohydrolase